MMTSSITILFFILTTAVTGKLIKGRSDDTKIKVTSLSCDATCSSCISLNNFSFSSLNQPEKTYLTLEESNELNFDVTLPEDISTDVVYVTMDLEVSLFGMFDMDIPLDQMTFPFDCP